MQKKAGARRGVTPHPAGTRPRVVRAGVDHRPGHSPAGTPIAPIPDPEPRAYVFRQDRLQALGRWLGGNWPLALAGLSLALAGVFLLWRFWWWSGRNVAARVLQESRETAR